jgi:phosphoglycerate dehydrogenase-like enzyme
MKIVIPDPIAFTEAQLVKLKELGAIIYGDMPVDSEDLVSRIKEAEIVTANYVDLTSDIIDKCPKLKYIISPAVGFDWIDVVHAKRQGISVLNCPTYNSQSVAELAISYIFALSRQLLGANLDLRSGKWSPRGFMGDEVLSKKLGLVGHGNIGKKIDNMATTIGMKVSYIDSKSTSESLDTLLTESDYIVVCAQLNDTTRNLLDKRRLGLIKKDAYLINVARGALIDQDDLKLRLQDKLIKGAALDVFVGEPLTGEPSKDIIQLARLENVLATPHMAASTREADIRQGQEVISNIQSILEGKVSNLVN